MLIKRIKTAMPILRLCEYIKIKKTEQTVDIIRNLWLLSVTILKTSDTDES